MKPRLSFEHAGTRALAAAALVALAIGGSSAIAHVFVARSQRVGAYPPQAGQGWIGAAFMNIPDFICIGGSRSGQPCTQTSDCRPEGTGTARCDPTDSLLPVETFVRDRQPDFTFRTGWIDFPAGPTEARFDSEFATIGDFLDDYIYDVSDPSKLDEPFGHLFLRFTGLLKCRLEDEIRIREDVGLPVWIDIGTMGYDGYRTSAPITVYRTPNVNLNNNPWVNFGPSVEVPGLFPIEVTYFNRYDLFGDLGSPLAGVELYGFWPSDKAWPAGQQMFQPIFGFGKLVPPDVIYQAEDVLPVPKGDFDADADIDLKDYQWLQICADPSFIFLPSGCDAFDVNDDFQVSGDEVRTFLTVFASQP